MRKVLKLPSCITNGNMHCSFGIEDAVLRGILERGAVVKGAIGNAVSCIDMRVDMYEPDRTRRAATVE